MHRCVCVRYSFRMNYVCFDNINGCFVSDWMTEKVNIHWIKYDSISLNYVYIQAVYGSKMMKWTCCVQEVRR